MTMRTLLVATLLTGTTPAQFANLDWQLEASPPTRNNFAMTRFGALDAAMVFGGFEASYLADTWLWQGEWRRVDTANAPSPRASACIAYDSLRQRVVLFGGRVGQNPVGETWLFDGTNWTQAATAVAPPARYYAAIVYDAGRDRIVMQGGVGYAQLNDLWEFDGAAWQQIAQAGSAVGTIAGMVHDQARSESLALTSTGLFAWNGTMWSPRSLAGLPPQTTSGYLHYDAPGQRVLLLHPFTGSTLAPSWYAYQGAGWTQIGSLPLPTTRPLALQYLDTSARVLAFEVGGTGTAPRSNTWLLTGFPGGNAAWQQVAEGLPPGRRDAAMAYHPVRRRMVLHAGSQIVAPYNDLYEADDRRWNIALPWQSGYRAEHGMVYDEARGLMLVFGGTSPLSNHLATWNGSGNWNYLQPANPPPARWRHGMAYDSLRQRTLVYGGEGNQGLLGDLWAWDGTQWTSLPSAGPGARQRASLGYDHVRDRMVLFGGDNTNGPLGDTWEHDGVAWQLRSPAVSPLPRFDHVMVYASHLQRTVLVGGQNGQDLRDTWLWDGLDWTQLITNHVPDTGSGIAAGYDPERREVIVFGGGTLVGQGTNRGELWRLRDTTLTAWTNSGQGCSAGNGTLSLVGIDPPALDSTCRFRLLNTPASFVALPLAWVGFDDQQWNGIPLPVSLAVLGAPSCFVWAEALITVPMQPLGSYAEGVLHLGDVPSALGLRLHLQGAVWNFATSTIATADKLTAIVGPL